MSQGTVTHLYRKQSLVRGITVKDQLFLHTEVPLSKTLLQMCRCCLVPYTVLWSPWKEVHSKKQHFPTVIVHYYYILDHFWWKLGPGQWSLNTRQHQETWLNKGKWKIMNSRTVCWLNHTVWPFFFFWLINWVNSFIIIAISQNLAYHAGTNP